MKIGGLEVEEPQVLSEALVEIMTGERESLDAALMIRGKAEGAIHNGRRVRKTTWQEGDTFPIGTLGTVLSSLGPITEEMAPDDSDMIGVYGYFVSFDPFPEIPVFVQGTKIEEVT